MNLDLAAAIREEFEAVRERWVDYLQALEGSPYQGRSRAELQETVCRSLEAWVQVIEGREEALREFVRFIVPLRMGLGFPLSEMHRASIGFRVVLQPLIAARYTDPAAVQAYADASAACDRGTLMLSEEWQRLAMDKLAEANRRSEERAEQLAALNQENRRLAHELSDANSRLHAILHSVDSAILLVGTDGCVLYCNARVQDLLGVDPQAVIGQDKREIVARQIKRCFRHPEAFEQRLLWLYEHMEEEAIDEMEAVCPAPRWLKRFSAPVRDERGGLLGRVTVYTDITEERRTQEILEEMVFARTRELQEMSRRLVQRERLAAIGELAAGMAHEVRNPLGIISNASYLLRRQLAGEGPLPGPVEKMLGTVEEQIRRCSRVITDLLDYARVHPPRLEPVDPRAVIRNALREHPIPKNVRLLTDLAHNLPTIMGDQQLLEQAISNLVANALRAMELGDGGELRLSCRSVTDGVECAIADQGQGMTQEVRDRIFEPLFTQFPGGTGLGLPLVKRIIEAHQGSLTVASAPGAGATFTVFLPSGGDRGDHEGKG